MDVSGRVESGTETESNAEAVVEQLPNDFSALFFQFPAFALHFIHFGVDLEPNKSYIRLIL